MQSPGSGFWQKPDPHPWILSANPKILGCKIVLNRQENAKFEFWRIFYLHFDITPFLKGLNTPLKIAKYEHPRAPKSILGN